MESQYTVIKHRIISIRNCWKFFKKYNLDTSYSFSLILFIIFYFCNFALRRLNLSVELVKRDLAVFKKKLFHIRVDDKTKKISFLFLLRHSKSYQAWFWLSLIDCFFGLRQILFIEKVQVKYDKTWKNGIKHELKF